MLTVRFRTGITCKDGEVMLYRDVDMPVIFPGLETYGLFGHGAGADGTDTVGTVTYDAKEGRLEARFKPPRYNSPGDMESRPMSEIHTYGNGWYSLWRIEYTDPYEPTMAQDAAAES